MLRSIRLPILRAQDLQATFLGELLFAERRTSPQALGLIKRTISQAGYSVSDQQIYDIYNQKYPAEYYWLLLKKETQLAGIRVTNDKAGEALAGIIPQLFNGAKYSQLIGTVMSQMGVPEETILSAFANLLAVLEYAKMACSAENITDSQVKFSVSMTGETINTEFVKLESSVFAENVDAPSENLVSEHFEKYKTYFAGSVTEENPYGFGYKLADRVGLEYIAVKLDDVSGIVTPPSQEEVEEYYQKNRNQLVKQVPIDPNDPNSPLTEAIQSYAEVADVLSEGMLQQKINSKAEEILQQAKSLTDTEISDAADQESLSAEQLKESALDYAPAVEKLSEQYKIKVYTGQTGLLTVIDMQNDEYLPRLLLSNPGYNNFTVLTQIVFAIDQLGSSVLGPFEAAKPRMYQNIGPLRDYLSEMMIVVRVVEAEKASVPENVNVAFSTESLKLEQADDLEKAQVYSVKEKVTEDLKKLAAMDITKSKAEEFIKQAEKTDFDDAVEKFNALYGQQDRTQSTDPNDELSQTFTKQDLTNVPRISSLALEALAVQNKDKPTGQFVLADRKKQQLVVDHFYSLVPQDSNSLDTAPVVIEFKPDMCYFCIKEISINRVYQQDYQNVKAAVFYKEDIFQAQSLAVVHFNPENIVKRMNFRPVIQSEEKADSNTPADSKTKP